MAFTFQPRNDPAREGQIANSVDAENARLRKNEIDEELKNASRVCDALDDFFSRAREEVFE